MSNRSATGKVLRLLHISAALRLVFVLFALGLGLIPAAAEYVAGQGSPTISPQDMERVVKATRDAVLEELRSQHQPASTAETAAGQDLEGEFSEQVASHGGVLYQRFSDALQAFPDLVGTVTGDFKRLDLPRPQRTPPRPHRRKPQAPAPAIAPKNVNPRSAVDMWTTRHPLCALEVLGLAL